ncbi:hypothetical protein GF420_14650 [candidate division GN15 bacterium]|nr:hypothetical protein [candidate division GN15 bacterium]
MGTARLKISVEPPVDSLAIGRGFYQLEEDRLYVQIAPYDEHHRFFSWLETDTVRFDLDKDGRLLFVEVFEARRRWTVIENFAVPAYAQPADIRWLDFREKLPEPQLLTDPDRARLVIAFSDDPVVSSYQPAWGIMVDCNDTGRVVAVHVADIIDDLAGREIAAFRKQTNRGPDIRRLGSD